MNHAEMVDRRNQLSESLLHLQTEASTLITAIGEAMIDEPSKADELRGRLRSIRDQIESTAAALTALRPRLAVSASEDHVAARVAAAAFCLGQLAIRDGALADLDEAIRRLGDAYARVETICTAGSDAGRIADDGHRTPGPALGHHEVAGRPLSTLFPSRVMLAMQVNHALWNAAPEMAKAMRIPTLGSSKHRSVLESLGHRVEFEPEALGEALRDLAVASKSTRAPRTFPDDGVRIVRTA